MEMKIIQILLFRMRQVKQYLQKLTSSLSNQLIVHKRRSREEVLLGKTLGVESKKPESDENDAQMRPPSGKLRRAAELYRN